jgi:hypothetical protein
MILVVRLIRPMQSPLALGERVKLTKVPRDPCCEWRTADRSWQFMMVGIFFCTEDRCASAGTGFLTHVAQADPASTMDYLRRSVRCPRDHGLAVSRLF